MKRLFRVCLLLAMIAIVALSLASCGNSASKIDDASGEISDIKWSYTKSDRTLTISGSGEIPDFGSSADVPWKDVRSAVEIIRFKADEGESFTKIGSYAFYGMSSLTKANIPDGIQSIGKCSFAFCSAMTDLTVPSTVTSIGDAAFETCSSLTSIELPESVTTVGESAFAFCRSLESVTVYGAVAKVEKWTFRDCVALTTLRMDASEIDADAFLGANIGADSVKSLRTSVVSVTCKNEDGEVIGGSENVAVLEVGETKEINVPAIDEYEFAGESALTVEGTGEPITVEYIYRKIIVEEEPVEEQEQTVETPVEQEPQQSKKIGATEIIAIVIFVVVIAGIVVGGVMLVRADKNTTKDSMTVRKNANAKNTNKKGKK